MSDLRNRLADIAAELYENEVCLKLLEAELEARTTNERFSHEDVFAELYSLLRTGGLQNQKSDAV